MESQSPGHWRIRQTFLSAKPRQGSIWPALYAVALILVISMVHWYDLVTMPPALSHALTGAPGANLADALAANSDQVFNHHQYWRLVTTLGVHGDLAHFLGNMVFFIPFAYVLNGYFGAWVFPALSLAAGALVNFFALQFYDKDTSLIGASGMVYFMVAFWLVLYVGIERRYSVGHRIMRCAGLVLAELAPQAFEPKVSYGSHVIGFILGISFGIAYFFKRRAYFRSFEKWTFEPQGEMLDLSDSDGATQAPTLDESGRYPFRSSEGS